MFEAVFAARAAAWDAIRPGLKAAAVDNAAREVFRDFSCDKEFKHSVGHGVGLGAISAQSVPRLHPKSDDILRPGMVFNLEPALYFEGYGGLRHCDMVALTSNGKELLTPFQVTLEDLCAAHAAKTS
jgi:Xaa-Pro dipeptidase